MLMASMLVQLTSEDLRMLIAETIEEKFQNKNYENTTENFKSKFAYSVKELTELLSVSRPTIDKWKEKGLKYCNVEGRVFFLDNHVKEFLLQHSS